MENLQAEIQKASSRAAQLSQEAKSAFAARDIPKGKVLMRQAVNASQNCQNLIQQFLLESQSQR